MTMVRNLKTSQIVTLIPGDGIGPEIISATRKIIDTFDMGINWDIIQEPFDKKKNKISKELENSLTKNRVALKGPLATPIGKGFRSINVAIRKRFELFVNFRPIRNFEGFKSNYRDVDIVIFRENTEDLYAGKEIEITKGIMQSIKIITKSASDRVAKYAFRYALRNGRKKITVLHKANIMKLTDGLFLERVRIVAKNYPEIEYQEMIVDNGCMQLVMNPNKFDLILTENLYGDIVSELCAGLIGGLGAAPGANLGKNYAVFEPAHGTAPDIAGKGIANPLAAILSAIMMLKHIGKSSFAVALEQAVTQTLSKARNRTKDMGGPLKTNEFADEIINNVKKDDLDMLRNLQIPISKDGSNTRERGISKF